MLVIAVLGGSLAILGIDALGSLEITNSPHKAANFYIDIAPGEHIVTFTSVNIDISRNDVDGGLNVVVNANGTFPPSEQEVPDEVRFYYPQSLDVYVHLPDLENSTQIVEPDANGNFQLQRVFEDEEHLVSSSAGVASLPSQAYSDSNGGAIAYTGAFRIETPVYVSQGLGVEVWRFLWDTGRGQVSGQPGVGNLRDVPINIRFCGSCGIKETIPEGQRTGIDTVQVPLNAEVYSTVDAIATVPWKQNIVVASAWIAGSSGIGAIFGTLLIWSWRGVQRLKG